MAEENEGIVRKRFRQFAIYCDLAAVMERFAGAVSASLVQADFHKRIEEAMPPPTGNRFRVRPKAAIAMDGPGRLVGDIFASGMADGSGSVNAKLNEECLANTVFGFRTEAVTSAGQTLLAIVDLTSPCQ